MLLSCSQIRLVIQRLDDLTFRLFDLIFQLIDPVIFFLKLCFGSFQPFSCVFYLYLGIFTFFYIGSQLFSIIFQILGDHIFTAFIMFFIGFFCMDLFP